MVYASDENLPVLILPRKNKMTALILLLAMQNNRVGPSISLPRRSLPAIVRRAERPVRPMFRAFRRGR